MKTYKNEKYVNNKKNNNHVEEENAMNEIQFKQLQNIVGDRYKQKLKSYSDQQIEKRIR